MNIRVLQTLWLVIYAQSVHNLQVSNANLVNVGQGSGGVVDNVVKTFRGKDYELSQLKNV